MFSVRICSRMGSCPWITVPSGNIHLFGMGWMGCSKIPAPQWPSPQAEWKYLFHHAPLHKLQRNLCSSASSTSSSSSSSLTLSVHRAVPHTFPHFSLPHSVLLFLKYVFPELPPAWLMGLSVSCDRSVMEPAVSSP